MRLAKLHGTATVLDGDANICGIVHTAVQAAKAEVDLLLKSEVCTRRYAPEQAARCGRCMLKCGAVRRNRDCLLPARYVEG